MAKRMLYLAAYDVADPKRLRKALHAVKRYATGGQKSAYECYLSEAEKGELLASAKALLDLEQDRFALIRLDPRSRVQALGIAVEPADPDFFYVA